MPEQTNPFKLLHDRLSVVIDYSRQNGIVTDGSAQDIWMEALGIDESQFYDEQFDLLRVVDACEQLIIRNQTINRNRYGDRIQRVKMGILCVGSSSWERFRLCITDDFMDVLDVTSDNMFVSGSEEVIPEEALASLQEDVEDIINRVRDSDIENELKSVLFDGLASVRNALLYYQTFGAEGIRQAIDRNFALPFRYSDEFIRASGSDEGKNIVSAFFEFLKRLNVVVSTGLKIKQISGPAIDRMLESGG